jgi:hypothetical protein
MYWRHDLYYSGTIKVVFIALVFNQSALTKPENRWQATQARDTLDRQIKSSKSVRFRGASLIQTELPFMSGMRQPLFLTVITVVGLLTISIAFFALSSMENYGVFRFRFLRIEGLGKDRAFLRLLRKGCDIYSFNFTSERNNFTFTNPIEMDGFGLELKEITSREPTLPFRIKGSEDGKVGNWFDVGSPDIRMARQGLRLLKGRLPESPGEYVFDYRPQLVWLSENVVNNVVFGAGCIYSGIHGLLHGSGRGALFAAAVLLVLVNVVCSIWHLAVGSNREVFYTVASVIIFGSVAGILLFREKYVADACAILGIFALIVRSFQDCVIFGDPEYLLIDPPVIEPIFIALGLTLSFAKHFVHCQALQRVVQDQAEYDNAWAKMVGQQSENLDVFEEIARLSNAHSLLTGEARHYNRQVLVPESLTFSPFKVDGGASRIFPSCTSKEGAEIDLAPRADTADVANPVTSLDQLYSQAAGVVSIMRRRCSEWAATSDGCVEDTPIPEEFPSRDSDAMQESMRRWIQRGSIKRPRRAVRKAVACYGGDVSRLVDICRARIVLDGPDGVRRCLQAMLLDAEGARIVRVKNTLDLRLDSKYSAGFRVGDSTLERDG